MKTLECKDYLLLKQVITRAKRLQVNRPCLPDTPANSWGIKIL